MGSETATVTTEEPEKGRFKVRKEMIGDDLRTR